MTLSASEQATIDAHWQARTVEAMPVPNLVEQLVAQRDQAIAALQAQQGDFQALYAELRAVKLAALLADQPCAFIEPKPEPAAPARVMPARALRYDRQQIGLLY